MDKTDLALEGRKRRLERYFGVGLAFVGLGIAAMIVPVFTTAALVTMLAFAMLFWGALGALWSYRLSFTDTKFVTLGFALVAVVGLMFLIFPGFGAEVLTMLIVASLLMEGVYSILFSVSLKAGNAGWLWMFASGIIALIVGFLVLLGWPSTASWLLGLGLGVNFLTTGLALILLGRMRNFK